MIYLISLGLYDKNDMSLRAVKTAKGCDKLYIERYTNYYNTNINELSRFLNKRIEELKRDDLESCDKIIKEAKSKNIGILIGGDALTATTHSSLILEAKKNNVNFKVIHGSSILTAVAETGLMLYNFGKVTSMPFDNEKIETPYNALKENKKLHTLFLLDLKNGKFMEISQAINYLLKMENKKKENVFNENTLCVGCIALGSEQSKIIVDKAKNLKKEFNKFPQCLIVPGKLHFVEEEILSLYKNDKMQ